MCEISVDPIELATAAATASSAEADAAVAHGGSDVAVTDSADAAGGAHSHASDQWCPTIASLSSVKYERHLIDYLSNSK